LRLQDQELRSATSVVSELKRAINNEKEEVHTHTSTTLDLFISAAKATFELTQTVELFSFPFEDQIVILLTMLHTFTSLLYLNKNASNTTKNNKST